MVEQSKGPPEYRVDATTGSAAVLAAVAHELKSPLQIVTNLLHLAANDVSNAAVPQWLAQAQQEMERIKQIVTSLLEASCAPSPDTEIELAAILEDSIRSFSEKVQFKALNVQQRIECRGVVRAAPVEIRRAFDNVIANALEAAPFNGTLLVHLFDSRDWRELESSGCRLLVLDDGPGIPQEHRSKIFEPFFTTKTQKGTGIGLWVVRRIVTKHRGSIHVRSSTQSPRTGTAVSLFFPVAAVQVKTVGVGQEAA